MAAQIELERARHRDDRFRSVAVLEQRELERRRVGDEEAAGQTVLLLRDPTAAAVLADQEVRGGLGLGNHGGLSCLTLWRATAPVVDARYVGERALRRCDGEHKTALSRIAEVPMGRGFLNHRSEWNTNHDTRVRLLNRHSGEAVGEHAGVS